jgi:hypothetical protein
MDILIKQSGKEYTVAIDPEDLELVSAYTWKVNIHGYVRASVYTGVIDGVETRREVQIHRLILDAPEGMEVDHVNRDKLDNRRSNLRLCTRSQNKANTGIISTNTSGYKGVSFHKNKWQASIRIDNKLLYLGRYDTKEEAAEAYNKKAFEQWGEFAWLNPRAADMAGA